MNLSLIHVFIIAIITIYGLPLPPSCRATAPLSLRQTIMLNEDYDDFYRSPHKNKKLLLLEFLFKGSCSDWKIVWWDKHLSDKSVFIIREKAKISISWWVIIFLITKIWTRTIFWIRKAKYTGLFSIFVHQPIKSSKTLIVCDWPIENKGTILKAWSSS